MLPRPPGVGLAHQWPRQLLSPRFTSFFPIKNPNPDPIAGHAECEGVNVAERRERTRSGSGVDDTARVCCQSSAVFRLSFLSAWSLAALAVEEVVFLYLFSPPGSRGVVHPPPWESISVVAG